MPKAKAVAPDERDKSALERIADALEQLLAEYKTARGPELAEATPIAAQIPAPEPTAPVPAAAPASPPTSAPGVPTAAAREYKIDELAVAMAKLFDAGRQDAVLGLLQAYQCESLDNLPKEQYGLFATGLRSLGGDI